MTKYGRCEHCGTQLDDTAWCEFCGELDHDPAESTEEEQED